MHPTLAQLKEIHMSATKPRERSALSWSRSDTPSGRQDVRRRFFAILAAGLLTAPVTGAQATPVFFTDEAAFQSGASAAGLGGLSVEGFESLADGTAARFRPSPAYVFVK
jgi:hypothetical protein